MEPTPTPFEALQAAVERAGSQEKFAAICGVSQPGVWKWVKVSKRLPPEHVLTVEKATGVSRHYLRPDIYPITDTSKLVPLSQLPPIVPAPARRKRASVRKVVAA